VVPNQTTTHFHPEHAFGAQVFAGKATYMVNRQVDDLARQSCQERVPEDV
jgi:glyoxylase-like metal-dependent hydrolase (beta-lactamase superfamily II)